MSPGNRSRGCDGLADPEDTKESAAESAEEKEAPKRRVRAGEPPPAVRVVLDGGHAAFRPVVWERPRRFAGPTDSGDDDRSPGSRDRRRASRAPASGPGHLGEED